MKIRTRLTLQYSLIFSLILILFTAGINLTARYMMYRGFDEKLTFLTEGFGYVIQSHQVDGLADLYNFVESQTEEQISRRPTDKLWLRVIDHSGDTIFESKLATSNPLPLHTNQFRINAFTLVIDQNVEDAFFPPLAHGKALVRVMMRKTGSGDDSFYTALAIPISEQLRSMKRFHRMTLFAIVISFVLVFMAGLMITGLSLRPITAMQNQLNRINAENLDTRIPMPNPDDELGRLAHSINNLFDRVDASFKIQSRFISDVSHEFKTPLSILRLNEEKLLNLPDLHDDAFDTVNSSIEILYSLDFLVQKLLYLSRLEQDCCPFHPEPCRPGAIIKRITDTLSLIAEDKGLELSTRFNNDERTIPADSELLYLALFNIIENAVKYTSKGSVMISMEWSDATCNISVTDSGIGISRDVLPDIFNRFFRADESRQYNKGYGIGLSIAKRIIELHRGTIEVESTPDEGTIFTIILPLETHTTS